MNTPDAVPGEQSDTTAAAIKAAQAVMRAYDRGVLRLSAAYMAETLRMLLLAIEPTAEVLHAGHRTGSYSSDEVRDILLADPAVAAAYRQNLPAHRITLAALRCKRRLLHGAYETVYERGRADERQRIRQSEGAITEALNVERMMRGTDDLDDAAIIATVLGALFPADLLAADPKDGE